MASRDAWTVELTAPARRSLDKLDDGVRAAALETIAELGEDPFAAEALQLRGYTNRYRVRFYRSAYRIVYTVSEKQRKVIIERVRPRGTAYIGFHDP
jgi:mRNA-degrading endonuclease RelE of RelBE toxin-antitoxin system